MANPSQFLAENILQLRRKRRLSQSDLSRLSSIPRSTIAHFESGSGNPSLSHLITLSNALQVSVEELLQTPRTHILHLKADEIKTQTRAQGLSKVFKLLPGRIPGLEFDRMEIQKKGRMGGVPHLPGTQEYFTCLQGEVTIHVASQGYIIQKGDVLSFPGDQAHSYQNTGNEIAVGVSIVVFNR